MMNLFGKLQNLLKREEGQGMVEYGMVIGFVALVVVIAVTAFGTQLSTMFNQITSRLPGF